MPFTDSCNGERSWRREVRGKRRERGEGKGGEERGGRKGEGEEWDREGRGGEGRG